MASHAGEGSLRIDLYRRKADHLPRPQLTPPPIELAGMYPGFSSNRRHAGTGLQRRHHQTFLLRRTPAPPPLNRCDDLYALIRHVIIPRNSHMTHILTSSTRRPLSDGYDLTPETTTREYEAEEPDEDENDQW